eukprot:SAG11_NODE_19986_length_454_cov_21.600000_1_plen_96_part_10
MTVLSRVPSILFPAFPIWIFGAPGLVLSVFCIVYSAPLVALPLIRVEHKILYWHPYHIGNPHIYSFVFIPFEGQHGPQPTPHQGHAECSRTRAYLY